MCTVGSVGGVHATRRTGWSVPSHLKVIKSLRLIFWWTLWTIPAWSSVRVYVWTAVMRVSLWYHHTGVCVFVCNVWPTWCLSDAWSVWDCDRAVSCVCVSVRERRMVSQTHTSKWAAATHLHYRLAFFDYISSRWLYTYLILYNCSKNHRPKKQKHSKMYIFIHRARLESVCVWLRLS